ncbi:MAG TPA: glycosyltransferase family 2 protein, partial [Candidatus Krumholzibacteria bacterium]|nr:glycosyltransferase family 2 protein [Candidatus Krumholzibacteria bacterium]
PVTCLVIAQNSADVIGRCLQSLAFADDVVVVDGGSHDDTAKRATQLGARVIVNPWPGFAEQRRFALTHARHDWVLSVDSDEEVPHALAAEITRVVAADDSTVQGYRVPRRSQFLGAWMDVGPWTRDLPLRLVRAGGASVTTASVHEGYHVQGAVATLSSPLNHYTHTTLGESIRRLNRYTTLEARDRVSRRRISALDPLVSPVGTFLRYYVVRGCWRAGMRGYLLSAVTAIYRMVLYIKLRELQAARKPAP